MQAAGDNDVLAGDAIDDAEREATNGRPAVLAVKLRVGERIPGDPVQRRFDAEQKIRFKTWLEIPIPARRISEVGVSAVEQEEGSGRGDRPVNSPPASAPTSPNGRPR